MAAKDYLIPDLFVVLLLMKAALRRLSAHPSDKGVKGLSLFLIYGSESKSRIDFVNTWREVRSQRLLETSVMVLSRVVASPVWIRFVVMQLGFQLSELLAPVEPKHGPPTAVIRYCQGSHEILKTSYPVFPLLW